ncbi:interleukin-1 receptor accessory protein-like isoform X3 [Polyodon spathula]|uniref:interleukin-1 receptor accessory protein-like isoform X3 n=1 Tax=Polyodon spathula TaxID=7913 RepID=UPI001B7E32FE|nr:interleukin-1 receptor accessory protein-like isoform X3 [Polyodon spathula]
MYPALQMVASFLLLCAGLTAPRPTDSCYDWGTDGTMQVYEGEAGRLRCPLFSSTMKYNYNTAQVAGLTLVWYWTRQNQDLEEPIDFHHRISKEMDMLWFRPASLNDTGAYICMLRNNTHCYKMAVPLIVLQKDPGSCVSSHVQLDIMRIPLERDEVLSCPDIEGYYPAQEKPPISWYKNCLTVESYSERQVVYNKIYFNIMRLTYGGNYTCIVTYTANGTASTLTRTIIVKAVGSPVMSMKPAIHNPNDKHKIVVTLGALTKLTCQVLFNFVMNSETEVWWTIDGKKEETFTDLRVEIYTSVESTELEDKVITKTLQIKEFNLQDVKRNYTCFARNAIGEVSSQATLSLTTPLPTVELSCGFGVTLLLMISVFIVCYVYWLELVLLYRAHFGTDESVTAVTDETLSFIRRSRRLIVVLSPNYLLQGSQTLLELKAGLSDMTLSSSMRVILVQFKPVKAAGQVKELKRARAALTVIKWKGEKSTDLHCRFWKQLHVALPVKRKLTSETTTR